MKVLILKQPKECPDLGYAERNPSADVMAMMLAGKLILSSLAFGMQIMKIFTQNITRLQIRTLSMPRH